MGPLQVLKKTLLHDQLRRQTEALQNELNSSGSDSAPDPAMADAARMAG